MTFAHLVIFREDSAYPQPPESNAPMGLKVHIWNTSSQHVGILCFEFEENPKRPPCYGGISGSDRRMVRTTRMTVRPEGANYQ